MWIFTRYGFFSVSVYRKGRVVVRARQAEHLAALKRRFKDWFGRARVETTPARDYHYRVELPARAWRRMVGAMAAEQDWGNFTAEVERFHGPGGYPYTVALHDVWGVMRRLQSSIELQAQIARRRPGRRRPSAQRRLFPDPAPFLDCDDDAPPRRCEGSVAGVGLQCWNTADSVFLVEGVPTALCRQCLDEMLDAGMLVQEVPRHG